MAFKYETRSAVVEIPDSFTPWVRFKEIVAPGLIVTCILGIVSTYAHFPEWLVAAPMGLSLLYRWNLRAAHRGAMVALIDFGRMKVTMKKCPHNQDPEKCPACKS